jgi:LysM repeat protein
MIMKKIAIIALCSAILCPASFLQAQDLRAAYPGDIIYMTKQTDIIEKFAYKPHTDLSTIRAVNLLNNNQNQINEGERLVTPQGGQIL